MKIKSIIALSLCIAVIFSAVLIPIAASDEEKEITTTQSFTNHERQLFVFDLIDFSARTYTVKNFATNRYLCYTESGEVEYSKTSDNGAFWTVQKEADGYRLLTGDGRQLTINDVNGNPVFRLAEMAAADQQSAMVLFENANGESREFVHGGTFAIKFKKQIANQTQYIYDDGEPTYTISKYSDALISSNSQNWIINYKTTINSVRYYTILNAYSGKYLFDNPALEDNSPIELSSNYNDNGILWAINEVSYSEIPSECELPNEYVHYYQFIGRNGRTLTYDSINEQFVSQKNAGKTPSSLLVVNEGLAFREEAVANIKVLGGDGSEADRYDPASTIYLKVIKDGNEFTFSAPRKNPVDSQRWEIEYVDQEESSGSDKQFGTDYFYYRVKNVGLDKYLTIKDGVLTMEDYTGDYSQQWCFYDIGIRYQDTTFNDRYTLVNRSYKWSMGIDFNTGFYYDSPRVDSFAHGAYGACWILFDALTDEVVNLNHQDPENIVTHATVMLLGHSTTNYLQVVGPEIESENALGTVYISASGSDENDGRTPETPLKSVEKLNELIALNGIKKRGRILFERGSQFEGELTLDGINGKLYREITFGSYGDEKAANPVIVSENGPALQVSNSSYLEITGIDFEIKKTDAYTDLKQAVTIDRTVQIKLSDSKVIGSPDNKVNGITVTASGNAEDTKMQSVWLDNITFEGLNKGIVAEGMHGATISNVTFSKLKEGAISLVDCQQAYVYNIMAEDSVSAADGSAVSLSAAAVTLENVIVKNQRTGNGIGILSDADSNSSIKISQSVLNNIAGNAIYFENAVKNENVPVDSLMIDNVNLLNWGLEKKAAAITLKEADAFNSFSIYLINSTLVKSENQTAGSDYYSFDSGALNVIYESENSLLNDIQYKEKLSELNKAIATAKLLPRGKTEALAWESFQANLTSAQNVYASYYPTVFDISNVLATLKASADSLDNGEEPEIPDVVPPAPEPEVPVQPEIPEEEVPDGITVDSLRALIEATEGDINLRAADPFVLTIEMQQLFIDANKRLTVTLIDENDVIYLQWIFPGFTAACDIDLGLNDLSENAGAQALMDKGRVISLKHRDVLPPGTKLIVENGFFEKQDKLRLYYLYPETGKFSVITEEYGAEKVLISDDNQYLQLVINNGGDFLVKSYQETSAPPAPAVDNAPTLNIWWIIGSAALAVVIIGAVVAVIVVLAKKKKQTAE